MNETINWNHYDQLVRRLETMPSEGFDYYRGYLLEYPSCVDCQCRLLMGNAQFMGNNGAAIAVYLRVTSEEARYLWRPFEPSDPYKGISVGRPAIENALYRLRVVAAKYPRPASAENHILTDEKTTLAREQQFLASVRALVREPLAEQET